MAWCSSLHGTGVAVCIVTQAQCAWEVSGPTRQRVNLGWKPFLEERGASRDERLTIQNENPVDETQELCVLRVDLWHRGIALFGGDRALPLWAADCACPKGLRGSPHHRLSQSFLVCPLAETALDWLFQTSASQPGDILSTFPSLRDIWNVWRHSVFTTRVLLLAFNEQRSRILLNILKIHRTALQQWIVWPQVSIALRLRNLVLECGTSQELWQCSGWVGAGKERTMIMKTTLKFPQGPYQILTGKQNKQLTMPCGFRIAKFALDSRWQQIPCVLYFFSVTILAALPGQPWDSSKVHFNWSISNIYIFKSVQQMELYCARLTLP